MAVKLKKPLEKYLELPEGAPYQLIGGGLIMTPSPSPNHQRVSRDLEEKMVKYVEENDPGEVLYAPIDVYLDEENVFQPVLVYISNKRASIITNRGIEGAPDLIVEILSPSTAYYDLRVKFNLYEKKGVQEYWIIDPMQKRCEIYNLEKGKYIKTVDVMEKGNVSSKVLKGFEVSLEEVFKSVKWRS
ncbi:MAG: Uma2 family endonuclease [Thermotoga sp.]|nr:MAG: Uma2 family endonuclease [Thermotoga sp.]